MTEPLEFAVLVVRAAPRSIPKRGEHHALGGFDFVVLHTKGGAVRWFKVSPAAGAVTQAIDVQ